MRFGGIGDRIGIGRTVERTTQTAAADRALAELLGQIDQRVVRRDLCADVGGRPTPAGTRRDAGGVEPPAVRRMVSSSASSWLK